MVKGYKKFLYYFIPILLILMSSYCIFNGYIWQDEAFSIALSKKSILEIMKISMNDVHPPLYYIILKFGISILNPFINNIQISSKIVSFIPYILMHIISITLIEKLFGKFTSFLFSIFSLGMPVFLTYAIEIRMYSYSYLFVTLTMIYTLKIIKEKNNVNFIYLGIFTVLSLYTHYFSALACVIIYAILMIYLILKDSKKLKLFFTTSFLVSLSFTFWLYNFIQSLSSRIASDFWIQKPSLKDIISYIKFPFSLMKLNFISYFLIIITYMIIIFSFKKVKKHIIYFPFSILFILTTIGTLISIFIKPIFINRYMIVALGCFWLSISLMINYSFNSKQKYIVSTIYLILSIFVIGDRIIMEKFYKNELKKLENAIEKYDLNIVTDEMGIQLPLSIYFPNKIILNINNNGMDYMFDNIKNTTVDELRKENIIILKNTSILDLNDYEIIDQFYLDNVGKLNIMKKLSK